MGKFWAERDLFTESFAVKIVLSKYVVLIIRITNIIIKMDDVRQERPKETAMLKLNKTLWHS